MEPLPRNRALLASGQAARRRARRCRSRTPGSSAAARTRTRRASSPARSTGSARSAKARMRPTSTSTPRGCPSGRRSWRCSCSSRSAEPRLHRASARQRGHRRAERRRSTGSRCSAPPRTRRTSRSSPPGRALGIDAALVGPDKIGGRERAGRHRARPARHPSRRSTASSPASSNCSGSSGAAAASSTRRRRSPPHTTSCSPRGCSPEPACLTREPSTFEPGGATRARAAARRQAAPRQLGRRRLPLRRRATRSGVCLDELQTRPWFRRRGVLVQELIPPVGYDLRLLVARRHCRRRCSSRRRRRASGGRTSASAQRALPLSRRRPRARSRIAAAAAIGADLVGVDLLPVGDGYTVIELNGAADFNAIYSLPGRRRLPRRRRGIGPPRWSFKRPAGRPLIERASPQEVESA